MRNRDLLSYAKLSYNIWNFQGAGYSYWSIQPRKETQFSANKVETVVRRAQLIYCIMS